MINENTIEQECKKWFAELGYKITDANHFVVNKAIDTETLTQKIQDLNLNTSPSEINEVIQKIQDLSDNPNLFSCNRSAHDMLLGSVKITRVINSEERTEIIKLIDFNQPQNNDFAVVSQLSIQGQFEKRRPDLIVYVNGLPLSVMELKNPADESATLENAYNQIQTYQSQIDDLFTFNLINVLSDGAYTGVGSITADYSRYNAWRKKENNESESWQLLTLLNGLFQKELLIDYLKYFVLFAEPTPGTITKKIAGYHQFYSVRKAVWASVKARTESSGIGRILAYARLGWKCLLCLRSSDSF